MAFNIQQRPGGLLLKAAAQPRHIGRIVKQHGLRRQAIAPGAAGFLIVGLNVTGNIKVHHKADVRLIDTHSEGHRRHHDL